MQSIPNEREWVNVRMRKLLADMFCPNCHKHAVLHDNKKCPMRFTKENNG